MRKYTPENIIELQDNEVFVFGSNKAGAHIGGAAWYAKSRFGAIEGKGEGHYGDSYALPTLDERLKVLSREELKSSFANFVEYALNNQNLTFYLTKVGCGIAGYSIEEIREIFWEVIEEVRPDPEAHLPANIIIPREFDVWARRYNEEYFDKFNLAPDEFRREYLNEPQVRSLPSIIEFGDGERHEWQPENQKQVEEFMRRCNLWTYMQEPDTCGNIVLKLPTISPEKIEEFKKEWSAWVKTSKPITAIDPEASIEFVPFKRPHRLHNHPMLEVKHRLKENEVIIDKEFVPFFRSAFPLAKDEEHWVVDREEFLERKEKGV